MNIGIIGCGFVGSATARVLSRVGHNIYAYDIRPGAAGAFEVNFETAAAQEIIFLSLPTIPYPDGSGMDLTPVADVLDKLRGTSSMVVLRSSVLPGTTRNMADAFDIENLVFMPEFLTMKTAEIDFRCPDRLIFGTIGRIDLRALFSVFKDWYCPKIVTTAETAELTKLASNCLFAIKVAAANEFKDYAQSVNVDWDEVKTLLYLDARIGCDHLTVMGGGGFGGACLPKDTYQLSRWAAKHSLPANMLNAALAVNLGHGEKTHLDIGAVVSGFAASVHSDTLRGCPGVLLPAFDIG